MQKGQVIFLSLNTLLTITAVVLCSLTLNNIIQNENQTGIDNDFPEVNTSLYYGVPTKNEGSYLLGPESLPSDLSNLKEQVKLYYSSERYEADVWNIAVRTSEYLYSEMKKNNASAHPKTNLAVVFDFDDTLVSSYRSESTKSDLAFDHNEFLDDYVSAPNSPPIEGTQWLYYKALEMGYKVIVMTGRSHSNLFNMSAMTPEQVNLTHAYAENLIKHDASFGGYNRSDFITEDKEKGVFHVDYFGLTEFDLAANGYHKGTWSHLQLREDAHDAKMTATEFKHKYRQMWTEQGLYTIAACVGDQYSDCGTPSPSVDANTGFIVKLPNYIYYTA
eukprot:Nk52_evm5s2192 gene=Nk52_evmTU5s2192